MKKKILVGSLILFTTLFLTGIIAYAGIWYVVKSRLDSGWHEILAQTAEESNIEITGREFKISGFPGPFRIHDNLHITNGNTTLQIPSFDIISFFMPGRPFKIELAEGIKIEDNQKKELFSLSDLMIELTIPETFPTGWEKDAVLVWQNKGGSIPIDQFSISKETLEINGSGLIKLDENLQPDITFAVNVTGYKDFITWLYENGAIEQKNYTIIQAVLPALKKNKKGQQNNEHNEDLIEFDLTIQRQKLFLGPLKVLDIPKVHWD